LKVLERRQSGDFPEKASRELSRLAALYPDWKIEEGERAHFTMWTSSWIGAPSDYSTKDLLGLPRAELKRVLVETEIEREGLLETWRAAAAQHPARALTLLCALSQESDPASADIWRVTLSALGERIPVPNFARRLLNLISQASDELLTEEDMVYAVTGALQAIAKQDQLPVSENLFWRTWDRIVDQLIAAGGEVSTPGNDEWVTLALNRPIGELTEVLLNLTFRRGLKVGDKIPTDLRPRYDKLAAAEPGILRLARVMMVSRLVYLFAVDPIWVSKNLIPYLNWDRSEDEAVALWRAYSWHERINAELWAAISSYLLDAFRPERLARLDSDGARLGVLITVVGIEYPEAEMPAARVREAILVMEPAARAESLAWISQLLAASKGEVSPEAEGGTRTRSDWLWHERVRPWLLLVWPRNREAVHPTTSEKFALIAIATEHRFPEAIERLLPFVGPVDYWRLPFLELIKSSHPDQSPDATLQLLDRLIAPYTRVRDNELRKLLGRIYASKPAIGDEPSFRRLAVGVQWIRPA
jgi:hypothetical protein